MIYLLWHHEEHGPEGLVATTRRDDVLAMASEYGLREECVERLKVALLGTDDELLKTHKEGMNLDNGWGGTHFQVVKNFVAP